MHLQPKNKWVGVRCGLIGSFLLLILVWQTSVAQSLALNSTSQGATNTQDSQNLSDFLDRVGQAFQIKFVYESGLIDGKVINATMLEATSMKNDLKRKSLEKILIEVLEPHLLTFERVYSNYYVIQKKGEENQDRKILNKIDINTSEETEKQAYEKNIQKISSRMIKTARSVDQTVRGQVTDNEGSPLPGATIIEKGTNNGVAADIGGSFTINVSGPESVLVFSYIGFETKEVPLNGQSTVNVVLNASSDALEELVFVGYSSRKKANLTGAVSQVEVENLEKTRVSNVSQALQGQVAGVQVTSSSGAPGDPIQVRIRGEGTIGNNNPLYVVDGIPTRDITFLNQGDIMNMTVLKDAAASAIYGSRASGGVILITTKGGSEGKISVGLDYFTGIQKASNLPQMLNAEQYINILEKAWNNSDRDEPNPYTADRARADFADTDWLDELLTQGKTQSAQLNISGGNEKIRFLTSLSYFGQDGIMIYDNDRYKRTNFRTNIDTDLTDRLKMGFNLQLSFEKQDRIASTGESLVRYALLRAPVIPVYKDENDPTYSERDPFTDLPFYTPTDYDVALQRSLYEVVGNPIAQAYFTDNVQNSFTTFGNIYGEYAFLKDKSLKFRTNVGIDLNYFHNKAFGENYGDDDGGGNAIDQGLGRQNRPSSLNESRGEALTVTFNNTLNYEKTFALRHDVSALVGTEYIENYASSIGGSRLRFPYTANEFRYLDYGNNELDVNNSGSASEWALFSVFGSATYVLDQKYMITGNLRADASSRFSENNRWGYFPSVSIGWELANENFLKDIDFISDLKLRASWGELGNQEIANYAYLTLVSQVDGIVKVDRYGNPDLKWESSTQSNIGLDLGLFGNKFSVSSEYFQKNTTDILLPIGLPSVVGDVSPTIVNAGEVSNSGFEFSLNYRNIDREFKYSINANFATLNNNVEKLAPNVPNIVGTVTRTEPGHPLNSYFGYKMTGIYQNQAEIESHLPGNSDLKPGDIKFADINDDGIINSDDRQHIGSPIPDLTYGLAFSASYVGFDFSFLFQGVEGVDRYNQGKQIVDYDTRPFNYTTNILGAWDGEGSTNSIPRVAFEDNGSSRVSSIFVEDASYLRLKNIELGYTLPSIKELQQVRIYISGQNLFTVTNYSGFDPESTNLMDFGTYPSSTSILLGINAKF